MTALLVDSKTAAASLGISPGELAKIHSDRLPRRYVGSTGKLVRFLVADLETYARSTPTERP